MKKLILLCSFLILLSVTVFAVPYYDTGSQNFTISIGTNVPLTNSVYLNDNDTWELVTGLGPGKGEKSTNFTFGGYGSIDYEVFIHPLISVGGELGYQFNFVADGKVFTMVPFLARVTFIPLQGSFEIPISIGAGMNYLSYNSNSHLSLYATLNLGCRYFFNESWGLGLNSGINLSYELYPDNEHMNGLMTYIPINLTITYRH